MILKNSDAKIVLNKEGITGRVIESSPKMEIVRLTIEPGFEVEKHALPFDVKFFVIDGEGILTLGEDSHVIKADTYITCDKQIERGWKNLGARNLELLVIKNILP